MGWERAQCLPVSPSLLILSAKVTPTVANLLQSFSLLRRLIPSRAFQQHSEEATSAL